MDGAETNIAKKKKKKKKKKEMKKKSNKKTKGNHGFPESPAS